MGGEAVRLLDENFERLQQPVYSCQFNAIESFWSLVKRNFKTAALRKVGQVKFEGQLRELVYDVLMSIPQGKIRAFESANHGYLLEILAAGFP